MDHMLKGVQKLTNNVFPEKKKFFETLAARQQKLWALFITCPDSRVEPNLITQTVPGDLF